MTSKETKTFYSYNKHAEHEDRTSLGKLKSKYWTTKQLVIKKLGREEDEFVIASDADIDAKLELLQTVKRSCDDLSRIVERYETNILILSHEETDLARFLKDYAQFDKTRAGKMMGSVSKVLTYTAQQRLNLRQPLLRLHNEIETFRHRAVTDTFSTVKRMETARTEYRGSILWLKDASTQLDPEKELEKFRRVQNQVKSNKSEYDRLKSDVIQKIDLLIASRCNMFSHVLAPYQKVLLTFWAKTAKIMSSVADSFKGYQYYEFTVIKDLAEPSRLLAEMNSSSFRDKQIERKKNETKKENDEVLLDLEEKNVASINKPIAGQETTAESLIDVSDCRFEEKLTTNDQSANEQNLLEFLENRADDEKLLNDLFPSSSNFPVKTESQLDELVKQENSNSFLPSTLLNEFLTNSNKNDLTNSDKTNRNKNDWFDLFAELDPLQNPDAIGKTSNDEADRSC